MAPEIQKPELKNNIEQRTFSTGLYLEFFTNFLHASGNPLYTDALINSYDTTVQQLASYTHAEKDGFMLVGSIARYVSGNGDIQTNWHIRNKAKNMQTNYIHNPENQADFARIAGPDQDSDFGFSFTPEGSLKDVYDDLKSHAKNVRETQYQEWSEDKTQMLDKSRLEFTDKNGTHIKVEYGPLTVNPNITGIKIGFHDKKDVRLLHIDISQFPKTEEETINQNRLGKNTIDAQDIRIPIHVNEKKQTVYTLDSKKIHNLVHMESINVEKKTNLQVIELAARALREHLIHSEALFTDPSLKSLTPIFYTTEDPKDLFDIRKVIQTFVRKGETLPTYLQDMVRTELLVSMANDPYETAKFLQDTGLYLLIPGLRNFNHTDWKNLYTSTAFAFAQPGEQITGKEGRTMESVGHSHRSFKDVKWEDTVNGIKMFIRAFGETIKNKVPGLDLQDYDQMYALLFKTEAKKFSARSQYVNVANSLIALFKTYPSGVTEKEMQGYLQAMSPQPITTEEFQKELFEIKKRGLIDKVVRTKANGSRIAFYSPRFTKEGELESKTTLLTHPDMQETIKKIDLFGVDEPTKILLARLLQQLSCHTVESIRPLRSYERAYLVSEMESLVLQQKDIHISKASITEYIYQIQKACVEFGGKRSI